MPEEGTRSYEGSRKCAEWRGIRASMMSAAIGFAVTVIDEAQGENTSCWRSPAAGSPIDGAATRSRPGQRQLRYANRPAPTPTSLTRPQHHRECLATAPRRRIIGILAVVLPTCSEIEHISVLCDGTSASAALVSARLGIPRRGRAGRCGGTPPCDPR